MKNNTQFQMLIGCLIVSKLVKVNSSDDGQKNFNVTYLSEYRTRKVGHLWRSCKIDSIKLC